MFDCGMISNATADRCIGGMVVFSTDLPWKFILIGLLVIGIYVLLFDNKDKVKAVMIHISNKDNPK